jgi:hypothetical protein
LVTLRAVSWVVSMVALLAERMVDEWAVRMVVESVFQSVAMMAGDLGGSMVA